MPPRRQSCDDSSERHMPLSKIPVGDDPPREINVIIENPLGGDPVKYELDKESGAMFVDRFLHTCLLYTSPSPRDS